MSESLIIVFVKNQTLGKVKTRLAKTVGNKNALYVYKTLVKITENATNNSPIDKHIYFSDTIDETLWKHNPKYTQKGINLGERMKNAFKKGFNNGYKHIVLIGTDLPDITTNHLQQSFNHLKKHSVVLGPAQDGGYYLIGLTKMHNFIFDNKPWSKSNLLESTINELKNNKITFTTLNTLNDIDTFEDLVTSKLYQTNTQLQETIKQKHD